MPTDPPAGELVPAAGPLPARARADFGSRPFGIYVHVPFCASRCGYCDFNTYTASELGGGGAQAAFADLTISELGQARRCLGEADVPVRTVFFGGGTPTLLPAEDLGRIVQAIGAEFGLADGVEVSAEANPESVDPAYLGRLREAGISRLSLGMQSARDHVLAALDRRHRPGRAAQAVGWARTAGFDQVSLDLIYGAPGESDDDWRASLAAAVATAPDHVSTYALIVEDGTRLGRQVARGEVAVATDDTLADRYLIADEVLSTAGLPWYEVSNWGQPCQHNLGYWRSDDWWGVGPGAHSHLSGTRWWNVRHPSAYAARLAADRSPAQAREVLDDAARRTEAVMLGLRLAEGLPLRLLRPAGRGAAARACGDGLLQPIAYAAGRAVLTRPGRLLADAVVRDLLD